MKISNENKRSSILSELEELNTLVDSLDKAVNRLGERLSPVLMAPGPCEPKPKQLENPSPGMNSDVMGRITRTALKLSEVTNMVNEIEIRTQL